MSFLGLANVDALAEMLGKSRATVYRYGKPEGLAGFSEPPYTVLKMLLLQGVPVELLFGIPCPCSQKSEESTLESRVAELERILGAQKEKAG